MDTVGDAIASVSVGRRPRWGAGTTRQDIREMIQLIRFVDERRAWLVAGHSGSGLDACDALLAVLRQELREILPLRHADPLLRFAAPRPPSRTAWPGLGSAAARWRSDQVEEGSPHVAS